MHTTEEEVTDGFRYVSVRLSVYCTEFGANFLVNYRKLDDSHF